MDKKYQIFVSSTFEDLKEERKKVIEILLNKNCIPVCMEYFPATNNEQMIAIKQLIDDCDYYVLILGGKYGSIEPQSQKSYTQLEYEYAVEKGIPICAFFIENRNSLPNYKVEQTHFEKLEAFIKIVTSKRMCKSWKNADDLAGKVSTSLDYQFKMVPRVGWVRANRISSEEANSTILELKEENKKLKEQIRFLSSSRPKGTEDYKQNEDVFSIHYELNSWEESKCYSVEYTWNKIFLSICTLLLKPVTEDVILNKIEEALLPKHTTISTDDFKTILIQFMALKLITMDTTKTEYDGVYTYWVLTPYGKEEMVRLKAIKRVSK